MFIGFNSKLVQLEAQERLAQLNLFTGFNSKLVRLEAEQTIWQIAFIWGFNSKLVQLEVNTNVDLSGLDLTFQFQTGSIRSRAFAILEARAMLSFNSKLVRLEGHLQFWQRVRCYVSIPNWFD